MRRLAVVPLLAVGLLAGCSQLAQVAGDATGVSVGETCSTIDSAYTQYKELAGHGQASQEDLRAARDSLVQTLEDVADDVGGSLGDTIRSHADTLAQQTNLSAPESIEAIERAHEAVAPFCE